VEPGTQEASRVTSPGSHIVTRAPSNRVLLMVANFSDEALTIPKKTILGVAEQIAEPLVSRINNKGNSDINSPAKHHRKRKNEALYQKSLQGKLDHLP